MICLTLRMGVAKGWGFSQNNLGGGCRLEGHESEMVQLIGGHVQENETENHQCYR